jgi:hypothetical protein
VDSRLGSRLYRVVLLITGICTCAAVLAGSAHASGALSQGFITSDADASTGELMILRDGNSGTVAKATSQHVQQLVGILASQPLVAISSGSVQQVQVATSGLTPAVVSDINGPVRTGDKITASPLEGIGMKVRSSGEIVGTAQTALSDSRSTITKSITDASGKTTVVHIGTVEVQVNVSYYAVPQDKLSAIVPTFLVNLGSSIAGKDLSPLRVLMGFGALIMGFIIAGVMLQTAVRSGLISLGRNPLAHGILRRGLLDVVVTSIGILLITIAAFYLILKI